MVHVVAYAIIYVIHRMHRGMWISYALLYTTTHGYAITINRLWISAVDKQSHAIPVPIAPTKLFGHGVSPWGAIYN